MGGCGQKDIELSAWNQIKLQDNPSPEVIASVLHKIQETSEQ